MQIKPGVLAVQGNFAEHQLAFKKIGYKTQKVLTIEDLKKITHLVLPGGESTVFTKFFIQNPEFKQTLINLVQQNKLKIFGTCAGLILLSKKVLSKKPIQNLKLIDLETERNSYGSQIHSFETELVFLPTNQKIKVDFIRAPKVLSFEKEVEVLAYHQKIPVLFKQNNILAATFHPEYAQDPIIHIWFLERFLKFAKSKKVCYTFF